MAEEDVWTIGRLLNWTVEYLEKSGSESARLDTEVLLAEARGCERIELYTAFDEVATDKIRVAFRELVTRRAEGMPVAYLVGRREFYSLSFQVTPAVLIPRPETELVVITLLDLVKLRSSGGDFSIADVGTGSGILAVCAAKYVAGAQVTAIDLSPEAIEVAQRNAEQHQTRDQIDFVQSDLFEGVDADRRFDFIVSNPPYVSESELDEASRDVRDHEPHLALVAGPRGTEVIERLIPQAADRLLPGGSLLIEISPMIEDQVLAMLDSETRLQTEPVIKDLAGLARIVQATRLEG